MIVNPDIANTLILAVMENDGKAFCVGNLTTPLGIEKDVVMVSDSNSLQATKAALQEALTINQCKYSS